LLASLTLWLNIDVVTTTPANTPSLQRVQAQNKEWNNSELLKMARADLMISYPAYSFVADVDLECLTTLEARMFGNSEEAGPAGNQQWSLDAGQHHRWWSVSLDIPNKRVMERDYSDTELKVRKKLPIILFNRSLTGVIDSVAPYSATTRMLRLQTSCPTL
jgi:hypothetical protein